MPRYCISAERFGEKEDGTVACVSLSKKEIDQALQSYAIDKFCRQHDYNISDIVRITELKS